MGSRSNAKTMSIAVAVAALAHAALLPMVIPIGDPLAADIAGSTEDSEPPGPATGLEGLEPRTERSASPIALIDEADLGAFLPARLASFDADRFGDSHPLPDADADRAGILASHEGGEEVGGPFRETARRDHEDQRTEIWNGNERAQVAIESSDNRRAAASSPEAVTRRRERGFDSNTDNARRARSPQAKPRPGDSEATGERDSIGTSLPARDWTDSDPVLDSMVAARRDAGRRGRLSENVTTAIGDRGTTQADVPRRGRLVGALDAAAASTEVDPKPFELAQSGTGGSGEGVAGTAGPGSATTGRGRGRASSTSSIRRGTANESVQATRSDPYFRAIYRKLDRHVQFPRDLAKRLEQGTVIARFSLNPDGVVSAIKVAKTSGFKGFDRALVAALRKAGPFGRVPKRILSGSRSVQIIAPYRFSNPLIR